MAGKGSPPGVRYGGRKKGTLNKTSRQRAAIIQKEIKASGAWLAIERLDQVLTEFLELAEKYRPGSETPDEAKRVQYLMKVASIAADLAPYQTAKLQATMLVGDRDKPITQTLTVKFV